MNNYKKINTILIIFTLGVAVFFGILGFTSIQAEAEETNRIKAYLAEFEDLNQYQKNDTITPNVTTYSKLKKFDVNDNYLHNKKDVSKSVTTYTKAGIAIAKPKRQDISNSVTTYSKINTKTPSYKKQNISNSVSTYSRLKPKNKQIIVTKPKPVTKANTTPKAKQKVNTPKKQILSKTRIKTNIVKSNRRKAASKKTIEKTTLKQQPKTIKKLVKKPVVSKKTVVKNTPFTPKKQHAATTTLHYNKKELNTATNINLIESAPVYPNCQNKTTENDKKACLLTNVSRFVLDNFNNSIGKKAGLKKGFYEIRVLFIIDENGISKTYKVLGNKYSPIIKNEIKRLINHLPKMIPGKSNGKKVPVKYSVKVLFEVK